MNLIIFKQLERSECLNIESGQHIGLLWDLRYVLGYLNKILIITESFVLLQCLLPKAGF